MRGQADFAQSAAGSTSSNPATVRSGASLSSALSPSQSHAESQQQSQWPDASPSGSGQTLAHSGASDDISSVPDALLVSPREGWDLHCHTRFSDGTKTPEEFIRDAVDLGLHGVAITDHDTWNGWERATVAARKAGMPLIRGTEITAHVDHTSVHMLAYLYDPENAEITRMFAETRAARLARVQEMVRRISRDYPQVTWESVSAQVREGSQTTVGRPHIADALVAAGICSSRSQAFATIIKSTSKYYIPVPSPTPLQVTNAVKHAGGAVVVAHAGDRARNRHLLSDDRIVELIEAGLDGIEVWHRGNEPDQRQRLAGFARRYGLLMTGGSDWHGAGKPNLLGENLTPDETVQKLCEGRFLPVVGA
ncbi:MAG: PHP domain-containing protein [Bifidobacteriaceae bacterium]|nr:PHP domain-containing protein [Bifidobacteriaceae bacterium]